MWIFRQFTTRTGCSTPAVQGQEEEARHAACLPGYIICMVWGEPCEVNHAMCQLRPIGKRIIRACVQSGEFPFNLIYREAVGSRPRPFANNFPHGG